MNSTFGAEESFIKEVHRGLFIACLSANGAIYKSLGQRPRNCNRNILALKERFIFNSLNLANGITALEIN